MVHILCGNASQDVDDLLQAGSSGNPLRWIVPKKAKEGDRGLFHLPRLGFTARGVIGNQPRQSSEGRYSASVRDISLFAASVPLAFVRTNYPQWKWPTYPRSYTTIDDVTEMRLEAFLAEYQAAFTEPLTEGNSKTTSATIYERNAIARQRCIAHYGATCFVCGFSFGDFYGETAEGYIHVHHLKPLSSIRREYRVDPIKDLRPICPNCHAVVHLQNPPLSLVELKRLLRRRN